MKIYIEGGYILLSRKIIESEVFKKPPLYFKVWIYLLSRAQHKEYKELKKGQLRTSIPEIIEACSYYVGARKEKPTKDQICKILDWLRKPHESNTKGDTKATPEATMIATTKATHGLIVTIDNYGIYQDSQTYESNAESDNEDNTESNTKATRKQLGASNINKNGNKNEKNENIYTSAFETFWAAYPRKRDKAAAFKKYKARLKTFQEVELLEATRAYAAECKQKGTEEQYIKHAATFLGSCEPYPFTEYLKPVKHCVEGKREKVEIEQEEPSQDFGWED